MNFSPSCRINFFPDYGAIFLNLHMKRDVACKIEIMQSYTSEADDLYRHAEEVKHPDYFFTNTNCYKTLFEQEDLFSQARKMETTAREIRQLQVIADSGFSILTLTLHRKAVVLVKKSKLMFLSEELSCLVQMHLESMPYLLLRSKAEEDYFIFIFWYWQY